MTANTVDYEEEQLTVRSHEAGDAIGKGVIVNANGSDFLVVHG